MLILGRNTDQRVLLKLPDGDEIWVTVLQIRHTGHIRLGFDAPDDVEILREEVLPGNQKARR
jgi:carbon storage regulator CsrA